MSTARQRIIVAGHALRIAACGPLSGPTYVLVHGIGMSHRYFAPLRDALRRRGRVITVDLPGFGGLPAPDEDLDVAGMGGVLGEMLEVLELTRVVLVGHSMGAQWALEAAAAAPDRVDGLVLIGPVVDEAHRSLPAQAVALAVDTLREAPVVNALVFCDYLRSGPRWYLKQARHMTAYSTEAAVARATPPMLLMRGGLDAVAGERWVRRLRSAAKAAEMVELSDQPHNVQYTAAREVAEAIARFAQGLNGRAPSRMPERGRTTSTH
ncbi:alpha/beta fold hydrolase [Microbacterium hydrocarbonoxydans]|uniref:alpha/beta fold hydrolase n=1 Tax=Microbacterium hydrocarbonoxydans TaxID=273678 RepID=UPI002041B73B|nr:alpha/beta hydrolase [Microbacterium hydrocarbonoxydans]MCM3780346.1 alpha/beta hydrolase [Microbacterium hydrocarbonoxydans]